MEPRRYIAEMKKRAAPQRSLTEPDLPPWAVSEWQESGHGVDDLIKSTKDVDYAERLLSHLSPRLPVELRQLFAEGAIAVGEVKDPKPNAFTRTLGPGEYAIIFNSGLRDFIYRIARVLATRFVPRTTSKEDEPQISDISDTARLIAEIFWWFQETEQAFGPRYSTTQQQVQIASLLATEAEILLLAHEIGHVIDHGSKHSVPGFAKLGPSVPFQHRQEHALRPTRRAVYQGRRLQPFDARHRGLGSPIRYQSKGVERRRRIKR